MGAPSYVCKVPTYLVLCPVDVLHGGEGGHVQMVPVRQNLLYSVFISPWLNNPLEYSSTVCLVSTCLLQACT